MHTEDPLDCMWSPQSIYSMLPAAPLQRERELRDRCIQWRSIYPTPYGTTRESHSFYKRPTMFLWQSPLKSSFRGLTLQSQESPKILLACINKKIHFHKIIMAQFFFLIEISILTYFYIAFDTLREYKDRRPLLSNTQNTTLA